MRKFLLIFLEVTVLVIASGCITNQAGDRLYLKNIITDKSVYHSSDVLNVIVIVESDSDLQDVTISVSGINGGLDDNMVVNLGKGLNNISFTYTLPRCNVCGGIRAGDYDISCEVSHGNVKKVKSVTINIQQ